MKWLYNETLTDTDKIIANVILENRNCIDFLTVGAIAKHAFVSPSTVIKYVKKIGFENFTELKTAIVNANKDTNDLVSSYSNLQSKITFLLSNLSANPQKISSLANAIDASDYVILYGVDSSIAVLEYLAPRLREITKKPVMLQTDCAFVDIEINSNANNLIILVSPCLSEPQILTKLEHAKLAKTTTWTICETLPLIDNNYNIISLSNEPCTTYSCNYLCNRTLYFIYFELLIDHFKLNQGLEISYQ